MKLHISMGQASSGIRDEDGNIVGSVDWYDNINGFLVSASGIPAIHNMQACNVAELRSVMEQALGTAPTIEVFSAPLVIK